jgi:hypothetical protein
MIADYRIMAGGRHWCRVSRCHAQCSKYNPSISTHPASNSAATRRRYDTTIRRVGGREIAQPLALGRYSGETSDIQ